MNPSLWTDRSGRWVWRLAVVGAVAALFCVLLIERLPDLNGTRFHHWSWLNLPAVRVYPPMLLAALPALTAQWIRRTWLRLGLLVSGCLALQIVAVGLPRDPWDFSRMVDLVRDGTVTSYFFDAQRFAAKFPSVRFWLPQFPELSFYTSMHCRDKAPGQILYYLAWIKLCGSAGLDTAARMAGLSVMVIAAMGVASVYWLARVMEFSRAVAFAAATYFSLLPGLVLISPGFDQVHASATCLIIGFWILALRKSRGAAALFATLCGLTIALAAFLSYAPLTLGAICVAIALVQLRQSKTRLPVLLFRAAMVLTTIVAAYAVLYAWCGFNPLRMYQAAAANERITQAHLTVPRTYPLTLPSDLQDFALASGWISVPLLVMGLIQARRLANASMIWLGVGQIAVVWLSGFLHAETARLWLFLQPLVLIPIGVELAAWPRWARTAAFAILAVVLACMTQNLLFLVV